MGHSGNARDSMPPIGVALKLLIAEYILVVVSHHLSIPPTVVNSTQSFKRLGNGSRVRYFISIPTQCIALTV